MPQDDNTNTDVIPYGHVFSDRFVKGDKVISRKEAAVTKLVEGMFSILPDKVYEVVDVLDLPYKNHNPAGHTQHVKVRGEFFTGVAENTFSGWFFEKV